MTAYYGDLQGQSHTNLCVYTGNIHSSSLHASTVFVATKKISCARSVHLQLVRMHARSVYSQRILEDAVGVMHAHSVEAKIYRVQGMFMNRRRIQRRHFVAATPSALAQARVASAAQLILS